jgi:hypothetical protein
MSHSSSTLPDAVELHPVLQAALDSLDVELEEELVRYRRQRYRQTKQAAPQHISTWQPAASSRSSSRRSPQLPFASGTSVQNVISRLNHSPSASPVSSTPPSGTPPVSAPPIAEAAVAPNWVAATSPPDELADPAAEFHNDWSGNLSTAAHSGTHLPHSVEPNPPIPDFDFSAEPDEYLQSSQELWQSIAEETGDRQSSQEAGLLNSLLTPLGIGAMALVLLSSISLGYVIMHPASLDLTQAPSPANPAQPPNQSPPVSPAAESFASPLIPDSPNLAAEEFVDLNANNLSTVPSTADQPSALSAEPPVEVAPPAIDSQIDSQGAAIDPAPPPVMEEELAAPEPATAPEPEIIPESTAASASEPAVSAPTPAPTDTAAAPSPSGSSTEPSVATATAQPTGTYYVVTPYSGDASLEQARATVPEAYVRNFGSGASVQLGVFSRQENAQELLQELEAAGIPAEIYQP